MARRHHSLVLHVRRRWVAVQRSNPQQLDPRMPVRRSPRRWCKFRGRSQPSSRPSSGPRRDGNLQQRPRADHAEAERATFTTVRVATVPAHIGWQASTSEASAGQAGAVGSASLVFRFGTQAKLPKPSGRVVKPAAASESGARPVSAAFGAFSVEAMRAEKTSLKAMVFVATQLYQAVVGLCTPVRRLLPFGQWSAVGT